jgi:hypothetical protein
MARQQATTYKSAADYRAAIKHTTDATKALEKAKGVSMQVLASVQRFKVQPSAFTRTLYPFVHIFPLSLTPLLHISFFS